MQCLQYARRLRDTSTVLLPFSIKPLNVVKQIGTMLVAVSGMRESTPALDDLRRFVLSEQRRHLPDSAFIRSYFNPEDPARTSNRLLTQNRLAESCGVLDTRTGTSVLVLGEVAFPPMGYVAFFVEPGEPVSSDFAELCDLRRFGEYGYDRSAELFMRMPVRYPFGPVPGYYPNLNDPNQRQFLDDNHVLLANVGAAKT
jgi:hypothetical protein